ncbi:MAG: SMI1/KNR4 family protein [Enterobacterales bacterium]|nr:SMI1/KNR4 family protein [Enterobacterales bacterium]
MEDTIDIIREAAVKSAVYLELPSHDQLVEVEEEILLPIPRDFRTFLLECSDVLIGRLEPVTVADPGAHTHLPEVTANAWANGLPRDLMVVCQDGDHYYCISQEGEVQYWQEGELTDQVWLDIWQWAEDVWLKS